VRHRATFSGDQSNCCGDNCGDFSIFFPKSGRPQLVPYLDHPRRVSDGLYVCAKFSWRRCSSFDNTQHKF